MCKIVLTFLVLCEALLLLAKSCKVHVNNLAASRGLASHIFLVIEISGCSSVLPIGG